MEQNPAEADICGPEASILSENVSPQLRAADDKLDLSLEFLMGRALDNAMLNVGLKDVAKGRNSPSENGILLILGRWII